MKFATIFFILLIAGKCLAQSPVDTALTRRFEMAKGKLPMPVGKGQIEKYVPPPMTLRCGLGQEIHHNTMDILTSANAPVQAVFEGTVTSVFTVEGTTIVLIQHGKYFTIYQNLASANVIKGQHVNTLQNIGVAAENDEGKPEINFQIWKSSNKGSSEKLDPKGWLGIGR